MLDEKINTDINDIVLNAKGGFSAEDEPESENILETPKEPEIAEVPTLVEQNQGEPEKKELTEEEKHAKFIEAIKASHNRYHPKKAFGTAYKQKRKAKNRTQGKSRKLARKK